MELIELLRRVHPFRFLRGIPRDSLIAKFKVHQFAAGETIFRRNDLDQSVYLIESGAVEVFDPSRDDDDLVTVIQEYHFFGEWEAIFQEPRMFGVRARRECRCYSISGEQFRSALQSSPGFAQGFGTILRDNQGIFAAFDRFKVDLIQSAGRGHISIEALLPMYRALQPALHRGVAEPSRIDTAALHYAVRRLPENVTRTFAFLLVDELPAALSESEHLFPPVRTTARRRDIWEILPGKDLVLLRTGNSDLIDLVTSLCLYAVEARKIRERVLRDESLPRIHAFLTEPPADSNGTPAERGRSFLNTLAFSSREVDALIQIWPDHPVQRISEITRHREMFNIDVRRQQRNYHARRGELWTSEVARVTAELLGVDPIELTAERGIHIISSNTHSVSNCLNPWYRDHSREMLQWAETVQHAAVQDHWAYDHDLVYAVARDFFAAHPEAAENARRTAAGVGHHALSQTVSTGIQVQLIDLARLVDTAVDPGVASLPAGSTAADDLIVNIDYAFGEQAEYVIRSLLTLYGENIRSVNFLGKAGALVGNRGDILAPTAFIEQHSDLFQPLPAQRSPGEVSIHHGPMLTVDGTLLQNRQMLNFYRQIWNVIGIEMEGTHYYREILESRQLGVIRPEVQFRFLYYVSDLPLETSATLAAPLRASEGVPPLYSITRHILNQIIAGDRV
ncbi:MAG TPA: cyclic nucleotide-binding domain-containing protein [Alkalispirochaeta sp.]|nr:cyclic nucleotide-binding domain-containing protein [Alkalispirochaeta sp.]